MNFYPTSAVVPGEMRSDRVFLRPLRATDVELDYEAVMASREQLRRWGQSDWPADDFSLEENLADLERHEREHRDRVAFTFTVLDPTATRCLGCVYIRPPEDWMAAHFSKEAWAGTVAFWVRTEEVATELDRHLLATLREWFRKDWAFERLLFTL